MLEALIPAPLIRAYRDIFQLDRPSSGFTVPIEAHAHARATDGFGRETARARDPRSPPPPRRRSAERLSVVAGEIGAEPFGPTSRTGTRCARWPTRRMGSTC